MNLLSALVLISSTVLPIVSGAYSDTIEIDEDANGCNMIVRKFNPLLHKKKYNIGVYVSEGDDAAFRQYNLTFAQYLTATAGQRFDPPIQFDMVPVNLFSLADSAKNEEVDFFFSTAAVFSCMAAELGAQALSTIVNRREARGHEYELDVYGGVIFTLATNERINTIGDIKGKTIGAGGITMNGGGQTQFYEMFRHGLSYIADPKQVMFTGDERKTVQGVLDGEFEVGMARTDQIERHTDANGEPIDPELFKVINPQIHVLDDGQLFPFLSSTQLHPEWPVAALEHVSADVSLEIQEALLGIQDHATSLALNQNIRCDTTPELANLALAASEAGMFVGFRTARSYFQVRTEQQAAGFLTQNEKQESHCIRGETLYEDIRCPEGQYKVTKDEFEASCATKGLECYGHQCYCNPCVKAYEVAVFQVTEDRVTQNQTSTEDGCDKMSLCGIVEQTKTIYFEIVDNRKRENPLVEVDMHLDAKTLRMEVVPHPKIPFTYEFTWTNVYTQIGIMNVFFDGELIPQSPVRVQVVERQCDLDFPGQNRAATASGNCACATGSMEIRGKCVESTIMAVVISIASVILVSILGAFYVRYRNHKNDEMWQVNIEELTFDDPVEVIGQGSFGVVLLAQYRGTKVALKRAIKVGSKGSKHGSGSKRKGGSKVGSKATSSEHSKTSSNGRINGDSMGMATVDSGESPQESDPEVGECPSDDESHDSASAQGYKSAGRSANSSYNPNSLGFLAQDFGPRSKWAWLFPWTKRDSYHYRFKEAILGSSNGSSMGKTWHAVLCPWFSPQVRAEEAFMQEMRVLSRLRHPCITTVLGAVISRNHDPMLVMEHMEYGSLYDLLRNETMHLSGEIILQICRDTAQGLRFLHSSKPPLLHGDMKARNILIDSRFRAKLCDFGLSTKKQNLITGTPYWLAPEYLRGQTQYTTHCDIYSMGIILYEIFAREDPYKGEDFRDTLRKVCDRRANKRPGVPETCPPKMEEIMKKCWSPDPFFRPAAKDLDTFFLDLNMRDAEPLTTEEQEEARRKRRGKGDMLYELFPKHVADQLKAGQKVEPEQHEEVTVVFSDIVHFTDISRALSPLKVSQMLDRLYLAFDKVARKNNVFKVETIGDAYMGVTNLERQQTASHVKDAAKFAIDLVNEASKILIDDEDPSKGYVNIRVGFHSGPVVSNVIGSLNPRYGLFGDTVNTSSRMESNSKANRILCSDAAYKLLVEQAPDVSVKKRGKIAVKGKGDMVVYWVGDAEIATTFENGDAIPRFPLQEEENRRVDFVEPTVDEEEEEEEEEEEDSRPRTAPQPKRHATVDEQLWRRDLKEKLTHADSMEQQDTKKKMIKGEKSRQPPTKAPPKPTGKKSVKEAIHYSRR